VRGEFQTIATAASAIRLSEHLPHTARVMNRVAVIRRLHHPRRNHNAAAAEALTGRTPPGGDQELLQHDARSVPCLGATVAQAGARSGFPIPFVALPHVMYNVVVLPGQGPRFLGPGPAPLQVADDPNRVGFRVPDLELPAEVGVQRAFRVVASREVREAFRLEAENPAARER